MILRKNSRSTPIQLTFFGAAGTVTGSKTLIEAGGRKVLIDCGVFQGLKSLRLENWKPFPIDPSLLDAVILTHAHLDHSGALPLLVRAGFKGKIHATPATRDITMIILNDFARIQEEEANTANRYGYSKHTPARPLYTSSEAQAVLHYFHSHPIGEWNLLFPGFRFRFQNAGHILGSTFVELDIYGKRIVFSGDLGRAKPLILNPPEVPERADVLICESTYGDRLHPKMSLTSELARIVNETLARKGHLLIPSFAVGRAQDLIFLFSKLYAQRLIPTDLPIFLDSPMAAQVTEVFYNYPNDHRLKGKDLETLFHTVKRVLSATESNELTRRKKSSVVIAGSGMLSGGRILSHLESRLPNPKNTVLIVGFQAPGTRGRQLLEGAKELKIRGTYVPVGARVEYLSILSAHADQSEILKWIESIQKKPKIMILNHGEPQSADVLRVRIRDRFRIKTLIPVMNDRIDLNKELGKK